MNITNFINVMNHENWEVICLLSPVWFIKKFQSSILLIEDMEHGFNSSLKTRNTDSKKSLQYIDTPSKANRLTSHKGFL